MDKVIGLGATGCGVADEFVAYPEYRIYKINNNLDSRGNFHSHLAIEPQNNMQAYEEAFDGIDAEAYLETIQPEDEVLFVIGGGEPISGISLSLMEKIRESRISVLYVAPDLEVCTQSQKRDHKIALGILQEYARSGALERIFLVSRPQVEKLIGDVSINKYEKTINHFIAYVVAMINYYDHVTPVMSNKSSLLPISRIATFLVSSLDEDSQVSFLYPMQTWQEEKYYYGIPAADLEEDTQLTRQIKEHAKRTSDPEANTSFSVYSTTFHERIVLGVVYSKDVQT
jgi:hypothetical protein